MSDADAGLARLGARAETLIVRLGAADFGIPVERVREVLPVPPITRLPSPPPSIRGVASVRGDILPVMDLGVRLFGAPAAPDGRLVLVVDPGTETEVGLLVDAVAGLVAGSEEAHAPPPEVEATLPPGWIAGVIAPAPDRLVTLLALEPVLALHDSPEEESR